VAGAVCSNDLTPRDLTPGVPFPDIQGYELPAFLADSKYTKPDGTKFMTNPPDETVYSMWIGTNDVGGIGFLGDNQIPGTDLVNYTDCVYAQFKRLYDAGGRYFVLQNLAPLNLAPLYATPEMGGVEQSYFWTFKPDNVTRTAYRMEEQVATVNQIFDLQTPFVRVISREFPDARFAVMDMRALLADVYYRPEGYLNGTGSPVVQDFAKKCNATGGDCVVAADPDRFLWYDSLHPSEQTDRVIAREFVEVVKGSSRWATYW
jgi:phospholipase/lecithinase/hemolysin